MSTVASTSIGLKASYHTDLENHIREFQRRLGDDWEKYQETLSLFLIGKLSRTEMVETISPFLKNGLVKFHNKFLLMNFANSLKDGNLDFTSGFASFWNKKALKSKNMKLSQYEKFKQNIMGLHIRERRRIKSITRESGKKGKLSASITLTRHALLPRIPMIQDKAQQQLHVNNLVLWQQDVVNGINTPVATDNYEIPDFDSLLRRMIMTMREHGLTGGLNPQVMEVLLLGLEMHLKNVLESAVDVVRYRENKHASDEWGTPSGALTVEPSVFTEKKFDQHENELSASRRSQQVTLSVEDMYDTLELFPHLVEPGGPRLRLSNVMLQNDDQLDYNQPNYTLPARVSPAKSELGSNGHDSSSANGTANNESVDQAGELKWMLHELIS